MCSSISTVGFEASTNDTKLSAISRQLSARSYHLCRYESMLPTSFLPRRLRSKDAHNQSLRESGDHEPRAGDTPAHSPNRSLFAKIFRIQYHPFDTTLRQCLRLSKPMRDASGWLTRRALPSERTGLLCKSQS